jgi:hypothetical protein
MSKEPANPFGEDTSRRGPEEGWIDSICPVCRSVYMDATLDAAQRMHDRDEPCSGRLRPLAEDE